MRSLAERFWCRVEKTDGCWLWTGSLNKDGYGKIKIAGTWISAHRASWLIHHREIPDKAFICHHCDNPACVNPAHLFLGDFQRNMDDCVSKGRRPHGERHCKAKLTARNVRFIRACHPYFTRAGLAALFNVGSTAINNVVNGKTWRDA